MPRAVHDRGHRVLHGDASVLRQPVFVLTPFHCCFMDAQQKPSLLVDDRLHRVRLCRGIETSQFIEYRASLCQLHLILADIFVRPSVHLFAEVGQLHRVYQCTVDVPEPFLTVIRLCYYFFQLLPADESETEDDYK